MLRKKIPPMYRASKHEGAGDSTGKDYGTEKKTERAGKEEKRSASGAFNLRAGKCKQMQTHPPMRRQHPPMGENSTALVPA